MPVVFTRFRKSGPFRLSFRCLSVTESGFVRVVYVLFGYIPSLPIDVMSLNTNAEQLIGEHGTTLDDYTLTLVDRIKTIHDWVKQELMIRHDNMKANQANVIAPQYEIGDLVWVKDYSAIKGLNQKLALPYSGPYIIVNKTSDVNYTVESLKVKPGQSKKKVMNVNVDKLKPFTERIIDLMPEDELLPVAPTIEDDNEEEQEDEQEEVKQSDDNVSQPISSDTERRYPTRTRRVVELGANVLYDSALPWRYYKQ